MTSHDASEAYQEAELSLTAPEALGRARIREFERAGCPGQRGMVFEDERGATTLGIRVDLPRESTLRDITPTSMEALALLGALTRSLQSRNLQAQLIGGDRGVEAVLVSRHICPSEDPPKLRMHVAEISEVIEAIADSLDARGQELVERILDRTAPIHAGVLGDLKTASALIVPTFDEAQRDRMMRKA